MTNGEDSQLFSVKSEHNGIFIGQCTNGVMEFSYYGCTHEVYDYYHANTWSLGILKYCLSRLDYDPINPKVQVYWALQGKDIVDGLVCVDNPDVITGMVRASREAKTLKVIVDEQNKIQTIYDNVIVKEYPIAEGNEGAENAQDREVGGNEEESDDGQNAEEEDGG
ncbi:hypothetical protein D1007_50902 [Hordeum vulgare]|nr:hypothetical protein D1007_50902 [Hordeum vulgare]